MVSNVFVGFGQDPHVKERLGAVMDYGRYCFHRCEPLMMINGDSAIQLQLKARPHMPLRTRRGRI